VALASLAGCRSCRDGAQRKRIAAKIQLDWKAGAEHAFLYAGKAKGYFEQAGIDLQIVPGTGSSDSVNMVDAKTVDFALASGETVLQARGAETPRQAIVLAVFYPNTPAVIYSLKNKGIIKARGSASLKARRHLETTRLSLQR
jgi:NitT/TauT family transport system substrate-binding protein